MCNKSTALKQSSPPTGFCFRNSQRLRAPRLPHCGARCTGDDSVTAGHTQVSVEPGSEDLAAPGPAPPAHIPCFPGPLFPAFYFLSHVAMRRDMQRNEVRWKMWLKNLRPGFNSGSAVGFGQVTALLWVQFHIVMWVQETDSPN